MPFIANSTVSRLLPPLALALSVLAAQPAAAVNVAGTSATPTAIASLNAGQTYTVTASGIVDLLAGFNGGAGLTFTADGKPTYAFPAPYAAFGANGSTTDPTSGAHGPAYNFLLGSLVGTYSATPDTGISSTSFFSIGLGTTLTPTSNVTLYGLVNDTAYNDNGPGAFSVTVQAASVPEPAAWTMAAVGAALIGLARRRGGAGATTRHA